MINSLPVFTHEDKRRTLIEWVHDFPLRTCKVVISKSNQEIGQHYHKKKDEVFYLLKGAGIVTLDGVAETFNEGDILFVPKMTKHSFFLEKGSIMLGGGTKPFDESDDYK